MAKILVAEDSPIDQALVRNVLSDDLWEITFVQDGNEALEHFANLQPDVVVTDMLMPGMDGLELVRRLRVIDASVPVVLITGTGSETFALEALRAGATSYSPKSQMANDLRRTVEHVLRVANQMKYTHNPGLFPHPVTQTFVLDNDASLIGPAIENLQNQLPGWSDRDRLQIAMAMDEAIVNAMHHGNLEVPSDLREGTGSGYYNAIRERVTQQPFADRKVQIEAEFSDRHICVQITDEGPGFDPATIPNPCEEENLMRVSGRGLFLIRNFMDQVAHNRVGNQITMTKLRKA